MAKKVYKKKVPLMKKMTKKIVTKKTLKKAAKKNTVVGMALKVASRGKREVIYNPKTKKLSYNKKRNPKG